MDINEVFKHQCKLVSFYRFNSCCIETCKNHSPILESKCLLIERKDTLNSEKGMSDHEIKYFKNYPDVKIVSKNKKKSFDSVYTLLILDRYLEYCLTLPKKVFNKKLENSKKLKKVLEEYPFNIKELSYNLSSLSYAIDDKTYDSFSIKNDCKLCSEYDLTEILKISSKTLAQLTKLFNSQEIQNGSTQSN